MDRSIRQKILRRFANRNGHASSFWKSEMHILQSDFRSQTQKEKFLFPFSVAWMENFFDRSKALIVSFRLVHRFAMFAQCFRHQKAARNKKQAVLPRIFSGIFKFITMIYHRGEFKYAGTTNFGMFGGCRSWCAAYSCVWYKIKIRRYLLDWNYLKMKSKHDQLSTGAVEKFLFLPLRFHENGKRARAEHMRVPPTNQVM